MNGFERGRRVRFEKLNAASGPGLSEGVYTVR